ncbi:MAG: hypothetical protein ABSF10_06630 [Verrucomicrobiota bacterium]|jgi:hypothetical protein
MSQVEQILKIAQEILDVPERGKFFVRQGPGVGNGKTTEFMAALRTRVIDELGDGLAEMCICGNNKLCVDYYLPDESTIIEFEFSLSTPHSNLERDILKSVLAKDAGVKVKKLVLVGEPGSIHRHKGASSQAFINWLRQKEEIEIEIHELQNNHSGMTTRK